MSADLVECLNRHFPLPLLTLYLHHHPSVLGPVLFVIDVAHALWYFVAFQKVPLKCAAEVVLVSGFLS